jgi:hypothetical protein
MPAFQGRLSDQEARDLVGLIRQFHPIRTAGAQAAPDDFARRYAQLRKELDELRKQFRELNGPVRRPVNRGRERGTEEPEDAIRTIRFPHGKRPITTSWRPGLFGS